MPTTLTLAQLQAYQTRINQGGLDEVRKVYAELYNKGYNYAGWALGVANGKTLTGQAALDYMKGTALMGLDSQTCRDLPQKTIESIRVEMGKAYVGTLVDIAANHSKELDRDIWFFEARDFHQNVFKKYELTLSNWTLNTPMELIRMTEGNSAVEAMWQRIRDSGGDGFDGIGASLMLFNKVGQFAFSADPEIRNQALQWMDNVPGVANLKQVGKGIELFFQSFRSDEPGSRNVADNTGDHVDNEPVSFKLVLDMVDGKNKLIFNRRGVADPDVAEGPNTYLVRKGDSLWKIAIENGWDFDELKAANQHLTNPDFIHVGQRIHGLAPDRRSNDVQAANLQQLLNAEYRLQAAQRAGMAEAESLLSFSDWAVQQLDSPGLKPGGGVGLGFGGGTGLRLPGDLAMDPIGAFYESKSAARDPAASIALRTPVLLDTKGRGMTAAGLQALDKNKDGQLAGKELSSLTAWTDTNENGVVDDGERRAASAAGVTMLRAGDYGLLGRRSSAFAVRTAAVPGQPDNAGGQPIRTTQSFTVPDSGYRKVRDGDPTYVNVDNSTGMIYFINWQPGQIKVDTSTGTYLVGTDGDDAFDANYYANYPKYFNITRLVNLVGGDGNDQLLGSARADKLWGGLGNDLLQAGDANDQLFGEQGEDQLQGGAGNDTLDGGVGNDLLFGDAGDDQLHGGADNDELQGNEGNDALYGGTGDDRLFGQFGNDLLYGGEGDDILVGCNGDNEARQSLAPGETDVDWLYGGAGNDRLIGRVGDDYLDGGAGADMMEGGQGDDLFVVNSVNDVVLELANEGYDTVNSSVSYLLNANVEELRLIEGYAIHGTGNSLNNLIVGNSDKNILDGVTGADTLIGGLGDDTYDVDDVGDLVIERAGEGIDTVQSKISVTLGDNVEHLNLLDFSKPEKGLIDGRAVLVYGYPKANELDYTQGDAIPEYQGTCALTSIANLLTQAKLPTTEAEVVQLAIDKQWAETDPAVPSFQRGGSNYLQQQALLDSFGMSNRLLAGYDEAAMANMVRSGRGVIVALNCGKLWDNPAYLDDGGVNHVVTVTGVAYDEKDGNLRGFYIADSGRRRVSDMTRFVGIDDFRTAASVPNAYAICTTAAVKFWDENIDGRGNALDNTLIGNRSDNRLFGEAGADRLYGGAGDDWLEGGAGSDTYVFNRGDGRDRVRELVADAASKDVVLFGADISPDELWFRRVAEDLEVSILSSTDSLLFEGWFASKPARVELFQMDDGKQLSGIQLDSLMSGSPAMVGLTPQFAVPLAPPPTIPQPPASGLWRLFH